MLFSRTDTSIFGRWWLTVDRWLLASLALLILFGAFLVVTASPAVAERIGLDGAYFITRHFIILLPSLAVLLAVSLMQPRQIMLSALLLFALGMIGLVMTLFFGMEIKGARRWLRLLGFSVQPSEFVKPAFIVLNAWLLAQPSVRSGGVARLWPVTLLASVVTLLLLQPDLGMTAVIVVVWVSQIFIAGLPIWLVMGCGILGAGGLVAAYFTFPHVSSRIDRFLNPASGDTYQIEQAQEAFREGGLLGTGMGQGMVKDHIPDAHADFIFAVAGEEVGLIGCLILLGIIAFIVLRGFWRAGQGPTLFVTLAASGLIIQFAMQALINIGSSLHLLPTKGMTLPFVSYGGSSLVAIAIGMGMLLALTRNRVYKT